MILLIDNREPDPHPGGPHFSVETARGTLQTGDFSLPCCEEWIAVERKTLDDLIGCLTNSRERFKKELQRAQRIRDFVVIVEGSYADILRGNYRSAMNPKAAWESVIAAAVRHPVPIRGKRSSGRAAL